MALDMSPPEALAAAQSARPVTFMSIVMLLVSVGFSVAGHVTLSAAMQQVGRIGRAEVSAPWQTLLQAARYPKLWLGLFLFGISSLFWLVVLSRVPLSVAYPFVGLSYVIIVFLARFALHEQVPPLRWAGVTLVSLGIVVVGLSFRRLT